MHRLQRSIWVANRLPEKIFQWRLNSGAAWVQKCDTKMWFNTKRADKSKKITSMRWQQLCLSINCIAGLCFYSVGCYFHRCTCIVTQCLLFDTAPKSQPWKKNGGGLGAKSQASKIGLTSCVCSWKAYRMPSISCSSSRESTSEDPRLPIVWKWRKTP